MNLATLLGPDLKASLESDPDELREALEEFRPEDIAEIVRGLDEETSIALMKVLPEEFAAEVLEHIDEDPRVSILEGFGAERAADVLSEMAADERADAIQELPEEFAEQILDKIEETEPEVADEVRTLVAYDESSAGGIMTTEYVALEPETKVWQAIDEIRRLSVEDEAEISSYLYIVAFGGQLVGVVSLRDLILSDAGKSLGDIMERDLVRVLASDDQEEVARTMQKYDFSALPVVDEQSRMIGVVTVDDVVDVVIEEATEDAQRMGAVVPTDESYLDTDFVTFVKKRVGWLIVLFLGQLLTANVMHDNERAMSNAIDLVIFIPLILSSGGNSGSQSASLIIRALALGEVRPRDWHRIFGKELAMGLSLGVILSVVGFLRVYLIGGVARTLAMSVAVAVSLVAVVTMGTLFGSLLPLAIKKLGLDPAVSSTPFIASLSDVVGLMVYFSVAHAVMSVIP